MNGFWFSLINALALALALSLDTFVASFAYGAGGIKIHKSSALVISGVSSGILVISLLFGYVIRRFVPEGMLSVICFVLLLLPGIAKLCDSLTKSLIRRKNGLNEKISFHALNISFILHVYADPHIADRDGSSDLSVREAVSLAAALSLDGLAVGIGAAFGSTNVLMAAALSFTLGLAAVLLGGLLGNRAAGRLKLDLGWLSGAMLIIIAFVKLLV